jgi:hypothetical protein
MILKQPKDTICVFLWNEWPNDSIFEYLLDVSNVKIIDVIYISTVAFLLWKQKSYCYCNYAIMSHFRKGHRHFLCEVSMVIEI